MMCSPKAKSFTLGAGARRGAPPTGGSAFLGVAISYREVVRIQEEDYWIIPFRWSVRSTLVGVISFRS